jgi:hypothetical protein
VEGEAGVADELPTKWTVEGLRDTTIEARGERVVLQMPLPDPQGHSVVVDFTLDQASNLANALAAAVAHGRHGG